MVLIRLNLALFIKNRYNDSSIAMTLGVVANICSFAYLSRVMDDGKTSEPPQVIASRKDQVRANLINLTRLNFSPLKLLHYFSIIPHSLVNTRYFQLSTSFLQCRWSTTIHDTTPIKRIRNQIYNFISKHSKSLQDKIPRLPNTSKSFQTLLIEKYRCTCSSTSRRNFEIPYENPKITDRRRDLHRNETKLFLHHSNSRRNYGRVSPIDFEAFPVSWPAGHTLGKVRGDGAKNLAQPYLLPSNPGWKTWASFLQRPGTAEISLLKGCRWSFDFSRHGASKGKF